MIRVLDLETQNHPYYGNVAAVYNPDNYVVELGWQDFAEDGTALTPVMSRRFESKEEADASDAFDLTGVTKLITHNAQYEVSWFLDRYPQYFVPYYQRGGRVLCTAYAEYLISHQTEFYPSLNETAVKYGGTHKVDGLKELWKAGVLTSEIDPELLHRYLTGPEGDIANTAKCFFGQRQKLQAMGTWNMYLVRCDALVAYSMCEVAGMYVDLDIAHRNLKEHQAELEELQTKLLELLPKDLPKDFEFNWGSLYHRSALVYGGGVTYNTKVPYDPPKYEKEDVYCTAQGTHVPVAQGAPDDAVVFKAGKNKGQPKVFRVDTSTEKLKWATQLYTFPGLIKIDTLPENLKDKFSTNTKRIGEWVGKQTLGDGVTPVMSTKGEVLEELASYGLPGSVELSRQATLVKDITTYYISEEVDKAGNVVGKKGALQFVNEQGIIHPSINATATVTGRLSMSRPNLQNIPRGDRDDNGKVKSRAKEMFTSRFRGNGKIVQVDYSALEVVVLGGLSKDTKLLQALKDGTDMHCLRLAFKLKEDYKDVFTKCHDATHPSYPKYKQLRTEIKPVAFAAQYGASANGLAYATGVSQEFAKEFLEAEAKLFPEAIAFRDVVLQEVDRTSEGVYEREFVEGNWVVYKRGYWQAPGGMCYSFRQVPKWDESSRSKVMAFKATQLANYWNQGEAAVVMAVAMARIGRWLIKNDFFKTEEFPQGRVFLINNVHDAAYLDVHESLAVEVARTIKRIMEDAPKYMSKHLEYTYMDVKFPAEAEVGTDMTHGQVIK